MTATEPLTAWRLEQAEDVTLPADHCLTAFLHEVTLREALRDLAPTTEIETQMLTRSLP